MLGIPVEGDKVTGSSEVSLAVSCRQPCLPVGGLTRHLLNSHQVLQGFTCLPPLPSADSWQARIYIMYDGGRVVAFVSKADIRLGLKGLETILSQSSRACPFEH